MNKPCPECGEPMAVDQGHILYCVKCSIKPRQAMTDESQQHKTYVFFTKWVNWREVETELNMLSAQGWEFVSAVSEDPYIFLIVKKAKV